MRKGREETWTFEAYNRHNPPVRWMQFFEDIVLEHNCDKLVIIRPKNNTAIWTRFAMIKGFLRKDKRFIVTKQLMNETFDSDEESDTLTITNQYPYHSI